MKLIGVACTNPGAVGYVYAQEKGIYTTRDYRDLYKLKGLNMIVELTGRKDVANEISRTKPDHVRLMDHVTARLFWDIFQVEEERIAERERTEESLQKAHDELERRVEERTFELSRSNALLKGEITERRRVEEKLRKKNEELENFVCVVSHELKTPVIGVQGFSSRLLRNYQEKLDEKGERYLEQIQANARRMEIFSSFEDISSLEIAKNVRLRLQPQLKEKGIKLAVSDNLPAICCDGERISQVFENLLVNAIKFAGDTKNPKVEIGYEDKRDVHQFYVKDNGIGIDPECHQEIFGMFHRLKEIRDQEGTGIGLAIVERIVKSHGGKVWVESEKGKGATFYFILPKVA
jgi:signal transduction histidine kinase